MAQTLKHLPPVQETQVQSLGSIAGSGRPTWRMKWQPTPVFLPGESHRQRRLAGYSPYSGVSEISCQLLVCVRLEGGVTSPLGSIKQIVLTLHFRQLMGHLQMQIFTAAPTGDGPVYFLFFKLFCLHHVACGILVP